MANHSKYFLESYEKSMEYQQIRWINMLEGEVSSYQ